MINFDRMVDLVIAVSILASLVSVVLYLVNHKYEMFINDSYCSILLFDAKHIETNDLTGSIVALHILMLIPYINLIIISGLVICGLMVLLIFINKLWLESVWFDSYAIFIILFIGVLIAIFAMGVYHTITTIIPTIKEKYSAVKDDTSLNLKKFEELNSNSKYEHTEL